MDDGAEIARYVSEIKSCGMRIARLAQAFRTDLDDPDRIFDSFSADHWRRAIFGDALIRLRQISENNFHIIESLSLLATARYIFELSIWLRLFEIDQRYCLVYYYELLKTQERYWKDTSDQLKREIDLLKKIGKIDNEITNAEDVLGSQMTSASEYGKIAQTSMTRVDAIAGRHFSIYADQAKTNGYDFQAYLVEKKAIPSAENMLSPVKVAKDEFQSNVPEDIFKLANRKWEWRKMSEVAGILHEHDYIYSYASKILHATPASISSDYKNLERSEIRIFLRYIHIKYLELMDLAYNQPECAIHPVDD